MFTIYQQLLNKIGLSYNRDEDERKKERNKQRKKETKKGKHYSSATNVHGLCLDKNEPQL